MGCVYSKRVLRTTSFKENLELPSPPVTVVPTRDDLVLPNSHEFVARICKANKLAKKLPAPSEHQNVLSFISEDSEGERIISGNRGRGISDLQSESSLKEEKSEKHESAEGESEESKPTEINFTCELTEDVDSDSISISAKSSDIREELVDKSSRARFSRSKSVASFHSMEEYNFSLAKRKKPIWDRNSKMHLYYLGQERMETINEFSSTPVSRLYSCPSHSHNEDYDDIFFEIELQPPVEPSDTKNDVNSYIPQIASENNSSEENDGITQTVSENNSSEENNGIKQAVSENNGMEENNGIPQRISEESDSQENTNMAEENLEKDQSTETNAGKRRMQVRAKPNDLGGIIIPRTPELRAVGSLREWLTD